MNEENSQLWQRIRDFSLDVPDVTFTFTRRLARENGWSRVYAERVVEEYKRFVYLAMAADHEVTPSEAVDEAWHLHLTYSQSYWNDLCRHVLNKPLHHNPTRGGPAERSRHIAQYEQTLATYRQHFGHAPPADIWPPAEERFAVDAAPLRVDRRQVWVIAKPKLPRDLRRRVPLLAGALAVPIFLGVANPFDLPGPQFLAFYAAMCALAILVAFVLRQNLRSEGAIDDRPFTPFETACLAGGVPNVLRACLAMLVVDKRLQPVPGDKTLRYFRAGPASASDHEIERHMLQAAAHEIGATAAELLDAARPAAERLQSELQGRGAMESTSSFAAARWWPLAILGLVLFLGVIKVLVGLQRGRPVLFLLFMLIGLLAVSLLYFARVPLRTRRGNDLLARLKDEYAKLQALNLASARPQPAVPVLSNDLLLAAGLFGLATLHHPEVDRLNKSLKPVSDSAYTSSGCGASTGCSAGGGGCGGGGGGGGGCGGSGCGGCGGD